MTGNGYPGGASPLMPPLDSAMVGRVKRGRAQSQAFRFVVSLAAIVLAALGIWRWAWLVLALGAFGVLADVSLGMAIAVVLQASTVLAKAKESR